MARPEHGTWIGITKTGRLAVLLNFHEPNAHNIKGLISRGLFPKEFLQSNLDPATWIDREYEKYGEEGLAQAGGFTMFCGVVHKLPNGKGIEPFHLLSNRGGKLKYKPFEDIDYCGNEEEKPGNCIKDQKSKVQATSSASTEDKEHLSSICGQTIGISNSPVTEPWPKVRKGISSLKSAIEESSSAHEDESALLQRLVKIMETDSYPRSDEQSHEDIFYNLRYSVFIPPINVAKILEERAKLKGEKDLDENFSSVSTPTISETAKDGMASQPSIVSDNGIHYGTRTNTIILIDNNGHVKYIERTLHDHDTTVEEDGTKVTIHEFDIENFE